MFDTLNCKFNFQRFKDRVNAANLLAAALLDRLRKKERKKRRKSAFQLAGQIADGALTWVCPVPYLLHTGVPALRTSAAAVGRSPPPLVAYVPVAVTEDRRAVLAGGHQMLDFYAKIPFYANMFSNAGFSLTSDQAVPDALVDSLVISGNESIVAARLTELLAAGLDELMVSLVRTTGAGDDDEQTRLMQLIGRL
jgi:alkanesulfonate monooxygenase SsuD/methylene tetrahydromethanopterin reductase-like flavin-dependent oxidoreductase (luciferase family)